MTQISEVISKNSVVLAVVVLLTVLMVYRHHMQIQILEMTQENMCKDGMISSLTGGKYINGGATRLPQSQSHLGAGDATFNGDALLRATSYERPTQYSGFRERMGGGPEAPVFWPIGDVQSVRNTRNKGDFKTIVVTGSDGKPKQVLADANGNIVQTEDGTPFARSYVVEEWDASGNPAKYMMCPAGNKSVDNTCVEGMLDQSEMLLRESFYGGGGY
jgi:hypothetical protein